MVCPVRLSGFLFLIACVPAAAWADQVVAPEEGDAAAVSYARDVEPIFRAHCQGCHQPAKRQGDYVMTDFAALLAGGETGEAAIVPGEPGESYLVDLITVVDGHAEMPKGRPHLAEAEIDVIRRWIEQGAENDSPSQAGPIYTAENPPRYRRPPVITSIDISPDGALLAMSGFHEVLLIDADAGELRGRLVGLSERIESVRFSPDGSRLAVAGGLPGRTGEIQVWDVATGELSLSLPVTYDTLYGVSWSPDGSLVAFGGADNVLRAIDAATGEQRLFQGAHDDWIRDTAFTVEGDHLISVGRDMTCKLTEVATERFVDNITSITPGALRGGISSIARHPLRDQFVVGGADGEAKVYRVFRETARRIGDDSNLILRLPAMPGRIFSVAISPDGSRLAAASTLDGRSQVRVWGYDFDGTMPEDIKAIQSKTVGERTAEERKRLEEYNSAEVPELTRLDIPEAACFAIRFAPDNALAVGTADGVIRLLRPDGSERARLSPAPIEAESSEATRVAADATEAARRLASEAVSDPPLDVSEIASIEVLPSEVALGGPFQYAQLLVTAHRTDGSQVDVTRLAQFETPALVERSDRGVLRPVREGKGTVTVSLGEHRAEIPLRVDADPHGGAVDYLRDVNPVLSRLGCNQGTCHGSAKGANGFKLSLRGYDPVFDVRSLADDLAVRRLNPASPDDSLMLLKPLGIVPHEGGALLSDGEPYHAILRRWIADGAQLDLHTPAVTGIEVHPATAVIEAPGALQQIRVLARYADGTERDVTHEAFVESGNSEVATADRWGLLTAVRRGEAPILVRYDGAYATAELTVMGDREGFQWSEPPVWGTIDELVAQKWQRMKIRPSELSDDHEFLRRVHLDLTGLPPTSDAVRQFMEDERPTQEKRSEVVDALIGSPEFVDFWTNKWSDLLQVNRKFLGPEGASQFRDWIREAVDENRPYDQFAREILTASGSNRENPPASYFKILRTPEDTMENTTHLFLGVRFNCNKCHDHPFERWTEDQYFETAAFFAQVGLKTDPESGDRRIGGTAVEGAKPLYEEVYDRGDGEMVHERTGAQVEPAFPFDCDYEVDEDATRRQRLAAWMTSPDNPYFARSFVNRLWGYLLGVGLIEPIDDIRAGNPPTNPELLDHLTEQFVASGFDTREILRQICNSRTYQLSVVPNRWNEDDTQNYARALPRRLPAEVLFDAIHRVTGAASEIPGVAKGTRAAALPDAGFQLPDGFLATFGRPVRESSCECERSSELQLGPIMALVSSPTISRAIAHPENDLTALIERIDDDRHLVDELFLRALSRPASDAEAAAFAQAIGEIEADHQRLTTLLEEREAWWAEKRSEIEAAREAEIEAAETELAAVRQRNAPAREELARAREQRIAEAEQALSEAQQQTDERLSAWEAQHQGAAEFHPLVPQEMTASNGATFRRLADRSIRVDGNRDKGTYSVTVPTRLQGVTGFRLEALPVPELDGGGPGFPGNGNFVVTEFEVTAAPAGAPDEAVAVKFRRAEADFSQAGFAPEQAIDGQTSGQQGWAVSPAGGVVHWIVFEAEEPLGHEEGTLLTFKIHQDHNAAEHRLARFRISATTHPETIPLGLPEELAAAVSVPREARDEATGELLQKYFATVDQTLRQRREALAAANQPLAPDPQVVAIERQLEQLRQPITDDPQLVRLREDAAQSERQLANPRLTATEDLMWALINSPAFLFNH